MLPWTQMDALIGLSQSTRDNAIIFNWVRFSMVVRYPSTPPCWKVSTHYVQYGSALSFNFTSLEVSTLHGSICYRKYSNSSYILTRVLFFLLRCFLPAQVPMRNNLPFVVFDSGTLNGFKRACDRRMIPSSVDSMRL